MRHKIIILFFFFYSLIGFSQPDQYFFSKLQTIEGLSHDQVNCIYKDRKGFIWFGTSYGLNRYDGYSIKSYIPDLNDSNSICSGNINCIVEVNDGKLWIGTVDSGVCVFDPKNEKFKQLNSYDNSKVAINNIMCFYKDNKGIIYAGSDKGLIVFNKDRGHLLQPYKNENAVNSIIDDGNGLLLLSLTRELAKYDPATARFSFYKPVLKNSEEQYIICGQLFKDKENDIWVANNLNRILKFRLNDNSFILAEQYISKKFEKTKSFCQDNEGAIWIGCEEGLKIYDPVLKNIQNIELNKPENLVSKSINTIYTDNTGIVWIGTLESGVYYYDPNRIKFKNRGFPLNKHQEMLNRSFKSAFLDKDGILWVGTDYGLNKLNSKLQLEKVYSNDPARNSSFGGGGVCALLEDSKGYFWVGNWGGSLHKFDKKNGTFERYKHSVLVNVSHYKQDELSNPNIMSLHDDPDGYLWIGTLLGNLNILNKETKTFEHYDLSSNGPIKSIIMDRDIVWCSSFTGLYKIHRKTRKILKLYQHSPKDSTSLVNNEITDIKKDGFGNIWIATHKGLGYFNPVTEKCKQYTKENGLESEYLLSIQPDKKNNLWISTSRGISKFDINKQVFYNYNEQDGVISNSAYSYQLPDGIMLFGGINGTNVFYPNEIENNTNVPEIVITDFKIFNKSVVTGDKSPLKHSVEFASEIVLSYKESVFTFEFAALNYTHPEKNQFMYKLEGFDKTWYHVGSNRTATFTNIPAGNYVFRVKGSNNDGIFNETGTSIKIVISPPWWKTTWFRAFLIIFLFSIIFFWVRLRTYFLKEQHKKLEMLVEQKTEELRASNLEVQRMAEILHEADQKKLNFFINLSHEFRTPLTLIIASLEKVISSQKDTFSEYIKMAHSNANRLIKLINQILDIRKLETDNFKLEVKKGDIITYTNEICNLFKTLAENRKIEFVIGSETEHLMVWIDFDAYEKVIFNMLSNAFKFTLDGGKIEVAVSNIKKTHEQIIHKLQTNLFKGNEHIEITVKDSGIGILPEKLPYIFEPFYQVEETLHMNKGGTGIGLNLVKNLVERHHGYIHVESQYQKGTSFTLYLPAGKEQYLQNEISSNHDVFYQQPIAFDNYNLNDNTEEKNPSEKPLVQVVEDNNDLRYFLKKSLNEDYHVIEAENGRQGLKLAFERIPDLIISDIMMPEMDGLEFCKRIKTDEKTSHIPVILLTAKSLEETQRIGLESGANDYIIKPFNTETLFLKIKNLIKVQEKLRKKIKKDFISEPENIEVTSPDEKFLQKAVKLIEENISEADLDIKMLCDKLGLSQSQLYRKINGLTGQTVNEFVISIRIKRAAQLLLQNKFSISEIAYMVGFNHPRFFTNWFKKQYGVLPSEYSKTKRNN